MLKKVLVVDGDGFELAALKALVEARGFNVTSTQNGNDALVICGRDRPNLIITDSEIPGITIQSFLEMLKKLGLGRHGRIPLIALSSNPKMRFFFSHWDIVGFLAKPYQEKELVQLIMNTIGPEGEKEAAFREWCAKRQNILLCGPNDFIIQKLTDFLRRQGHAVLRAFDEDDVVKMSAEHPPDFVFNQYVEDTSALDHGRLLQGLEVAGYRKRIALAVFCYEHLKDEARKNTPEVHPIFCYKDSPELIRQVDEFIKLYSKVQ